MFFAVQAPFFSSDQAYFHAAIVERLSSAESPWDDALGFQGRTLIISPLFEGLLALFTFVMPFDFALKVLPNFFASLLVIPVFFLSFRLTRNLWISFASALLASLVPVFISKTFNHVSPLSLAMPLFFGLVYAWLSGRSYFFVCLLIFFAFLHPLVVVFVLSAVFYFVLCGLDRLRIPRGEHELGIFAVFFTLWVQLLIFKRLVLFHGTKVVWRNIPTLLLSSHFSSISLVGAMVQVGIYPVVQGVYGLYRTFLKKAGRDVNFLFAVVLVSCLLLWIKAIDLNSGMMLLGISLAVLFSAWSLSVFQYFKQTQVSRFAWLIAFGSVLLALLTTALPAVIAMNSEIDNTITGEEVEALEWLGNVSGAVVIAPVDYGHYVEYFSSHATVIDSFFFLQKNIDERFEDVNRVFSAVFETEAVELFDKYSATHLLIPPGQKDVSYVDSCFSRVYERRTRIYVKNPDCRVEVVA